MKDVSGSCRALHLLAIYSLVFLNNGGLLMSPAMDTMVSAFSAEPYSKILLISTLPSLVALPFILISGSLAGVKVRYRTLLLIAVPIYAASGVAPYFLTSLNLVLMCRAVHGVCYGLICPLGNALILHSFSGEDRVRFLGYSSTIIGMAGIVFQQLSGYLCLVGWNYVFLGYLIAFVPLFLIAFGLIEPEHQPQKLQVRDAEKTHRESRNLQAFLRPGPLWVFACMCALYICSQTKIMTMSSIVASEGMGDATVSASILSMSTVGAMLAGIILPIYCRCVKKYRVPILVLMLSVTAATSLLNSPILIGAGYAVGTMAFMMNLNLMTLRSSHLFPKEEAGRAVCLIQCADKSGAFLATYFTAFWGWLVRALRINFSVYKAPIVGSLPVYILLAIIDAVLTGPNFQPDTAEKGE